MPFLDNIFRHCRCHYDFFFRFRPTRLSVRSSAPNSSSNSSPNVPFTPSSQTIKLTELKKKINLLGIQCLDSCLPGRFNYLFCPQCRGGKLMERTLSLHIIQQGDFAMWRCFQTDCGWAGQALAISSEIMMNGTKLEPIGDELIAYFAERKISEATLRRNAVMQKSSDKAVIAFTYRRNGVVVGCKSRTLEKKFWQVEGEIDKLPVEEAGFRNCVSIPSGVPQMVSAKELQTLEKDNAYQYLWNCKDYLAKASRIILATDVDNPGNALAEELACRLGKERFSSAWDLEL